jgi:redox-sensitive bicupin YhaK (pirin superfamily)
VQWLTAGAGIVHSEMFPLVERAQPNPLELFQIWLNLPSADKMAPPHFAMLWNGAIPRCRFSDERGRVTEVTVIAGQLDGRQPPAPPPRSWAARPDNDVAIWCISMQPGAVWTLPPAARADSARTLYLFRGASAALAGQRLPINTGASLHSEQPAALEAGDEGCELLLLQGRPIAEPVVQYGPFVMNRREEIERAILDYQRTRFGGWPWPSDDPVHARDAGRFARHADGRIERMDG